MATYHSGDHFATSSCWDKPRCLIESTKDGQFEINEQTLSMLQQITDSVVVVAIVGLYRTGKSYLMNRLAGQPGTRGFDLGSTVQSKTKGFWVWAVRHPTRRNCSLLLLDTEGLGDVEKGDANHDTWIFALAVLLSSTLVYNSMGTIDQNSLEKLHFVTDIAEHIKSKSKKSDDDETEEFDKFFPNFIWAVRDFTLNLVIDGKTVTEDEYMGHALQLKSGTGRKVVEYNLPRECIRNYFPRRKCFTFPRPVDGESDLQNLESLNDSQLKPSFLEKTDTFLQHIFDSTQPKSVEGRSINGRLLGGLARCYVDAIRSGVVPCIQSAVESTAKLENERAIKESVALYEKRFRETVKFPTETLDEVSNCHHVCEKEAAEYFMKLAIFDAEKTYYTRMMDELAASYMKFVEENESSSKEACRSLLNSLHKPIEDDFKAGKYTCPGGNEVYGKNIDLLIRKYRESPKKGIMSEEALCEFMKQQEPTSAAVLKADEKLTEEAKKVEEEKQRADASERAKRTAEEEVRKKEQLMEDEKKSFEDHIQRVEKQNEEDRKKMREDCENVLEKRLHEQERLLKEGFDQKANDMTAQIDGLKQTIKEQEELDKARRRLEAATQVTPALIQSAFYAAKLAHVMNKLM